MDGSGDGYLRTAGDYVHLNPARAKLLAPEDRLLAYPWSSFPLYLAAPEHRPRWLRADRLLGEHGMKQDTPAGRQEFERQLERRRLEEVAEAAVAEFRQAWSLGGAKLALAARLRQDSTLTVKQIAERLQLGKRKGARANLHKFMNRPETGSPQPQLDFQ